jgi:hypothetical protein
VAKEVGLKIMTGIVVDYRPPLFSVAWSNGSEERFTQRELDFFRGTYSRLEFEAASKSKQAKSKPPLQGTSFPEHSGDIGEVRLKSESLFAGSGRDMSTLDWRLLEAAAAALAGADHVISVQHCPHLASGREPAWDTWFRAGPRVVALSLTECSLGPRPPAGVCALKRLRRLDLRANRLTAVDPTSDPASSTNSAHAKAKATNSFAHPTIAQSTAAPPLGEAVDGGGAGGATRAHPSASVPEPGAHHAAAVPAAAAAAKKASQATAAEARPGLLPDLLALDLRRNLVAALPEGCLAWCTNLTVKGFRLGHCVQLLRCCLPRR